VITKKIKDLISYILFLVFAIILVDLIINFFLPQEIKKKIGITKNYSLKSKKFHHVLAPKINVNEFWGDRKYKVITNEYGMRIDKNYKIDIGKKNIGFIGDSFVYGTGMDFKNHFINLTKITNDKYNYLNLGYVSHSPSIYFKKLFYFINNKNLDFKKIFIFIDTSDVQDEGLFYREDKQGNIVRKSESDQEIKNKNFKYIFKNYIKQNSFIFKFYEAFIKGTGQMGESLCLNNKENINDFKKYLDYDRYGYAFDKKISSKEWAIEGQKKILNYLSKIKNLLDNNNIEMIIVYYPSALDILKNNKNKEDSDHFKMLNSWSKKNDVNLIDTQNEFFKKKDPINNYKTNHIICDVHWNENGHQIIAKKIVDYLNKN